MKNNYFQQLKEILGQKRKKWTYTVLVALFSMTFLLYYFTGRYAVQNQPEMVENFLKEIKGQSVFNEFMILFEQGNFISIFGLIYFHNITVSLIDFVLGTSFAFPLFAVIANGVFAGFMSGISYYTANATTIQIIGFFAVLFLEVTATVLALVEGMYLSYAIIFPQKLWKIKSRRESFKRTFKQNMKVLLLSVFLLFIAGVIETFVIYTQWSGGLHPIPF